MLYSCTHMATVGVKGLIACHVVTVLFEVTEKVWQSEMVPVTATEDAAKKPAVQPPPQPKA